MKEVSSQSKIWGNEEIFDKSDKPFYVRLQFPCSGCAGARQKASLWNVRNVGTTMYVF